MPKPTIICLTAVRNEAWILDRFLKCASLWADHIIIADQQSDDRSREIARNYPKVVLIDNPFSAPNEYERNKILLEAARRIPAPRLLIVLDADEILTANFMESPEWDMILSAPLGSVIKFNRAELRPDLCSYWMSIHEFPLGFMDDGSKYASAEIHSIRIPVTPGTPTITLQEIKVLHYQYTDWERMRSKHRWYQCWERLNRPSRRAIDIYRQYHHMFAINKKDIQPVLKEWLFGYEQSGIDMTSIYHEEIFWWDREILSLLAKYGAKTFKQQAIWDVYWPALSNKINPNGTQVACRDPRNMLDKYIHRWLLETQPIQSRFDVRLVGKILRLLGW